MNALGSWLASQFELPGTEGVGSGGHCVGWVGCYFGGWWHRDSQSVAYCEKNKTCSQLSACCHRQASWTGFLYPVLFLSDGAVAAFAIFNGPMFG